DDVDAGVFLKPKGSKYGGIGCTVKLGSGNMTVLFLALSAQQFGGTRQTTDSSNGKERQVSHRAGAVVTDSPAAQRIAAGQRPGSAPHSRWHGRAARP